MELVCEPNVSDLSFWAIHRLMWGELMPQNLDNEGRYGCAASAKPRLETISPRNLIPGQKSPKNLMTGQVFMTSRVTNLKIFNK